MSRTPHAPEPPDPLKSIPDAATLRQLITLSVRRTQALRKLLRAVQAGALQAGGDHKSATSRREASRA